MIRICVDCNYNFWGPDKPIISENKMQEFNLLPNQKVIAYQGCDDNDIWFGIVKYDD